MEKIIQKPRLIKGEINHHRLFPKKNSFCYKSTYISFPILKINQLKNTFFSLNTFNIFALYSSDYGDKKSQDINAWIYNILKKNNIKNINNIVVITHPRVFGYAFNPVNFWLCFDNKNQLIAVLSEVTNTCGQKHNYLCFKESLEPIHSNEWLEAEKQFYVSPFMDIEGKYKFRFKFTNQQITFFINYLVDDMLKLTTSLTCDFQEFNKKNLLIRFLKMPFFTLKTIVLIHYQAAKLYCKSIKYQKYPSALKNNITIGKNGK